MSDYFDRSTPTLRDEALGITRHHYYPPPEDVSQYISRALPPPPTRRQSYSSSIYDHEDGYFRQRVQQNIFDAEGLKSGRKRFSFGSDIDEEALGMVELPEITIPDDLDSYEYPPLVSPRPQRPDSKLLSMWANGDELVSPIATPAEASWVNHAVSPLIEEPGRWVPSKEGRISIEYQSWFDDTSSDEEDQLDSSDWGQKYSQLEDAFNGVLYAPFPRTNVSYSDPGSPLSPSGDWDFGEPGPDVGGLDNAGRQTVQPEMYTLTTYRGDEQRHTQDSEAHLGDSHIAFAMRKIDTFSSNRPRGIQLRVPPPLKIGEQSPVQEDHVKTPFPLRANSVSSQRSLFKTDGSGNKLQKRRSGLGGFSSLRRPSTQSIRNPPPGFTEILSQIDYQGAVSPGPRVRNILSKAKHGLGIARVGSKKEKRRDECRHQIPP